LPACKPGIPDGNQAGPVCRWNSVPLWGGKPFKTAPPQNGAAHYARVYGQLQTLDWAGVYRGAAEPERNGHEPGRDARPRAGNDRRRRWAPAAWCTEKCGRGWAADQRSALPLPRSALPPAGSGQARWPVTSSSARSSSPSAGLQGADGTRSRCPRPDHLRSGWPSRDPVPDGSFHGHGSGC